MAGDSSALLIDIDAISAAASALHQQHDDSLNALNTVLGTLENQLHQLAQYVPNVIEHARGEHGIIQQRGSTLLGLFDTLANNLDEVVNNAELMHAHTRHLLSQIE